MQDTQSKNEAAEKAKITRERNAAARAARWAADAECKQAARAALQKVFEAPDATPGEVLAAAVLLVEIGKR